MKIVEHGNNEAGIMLALIFCELCDGGVAQFIVLSQSVALPKIGIPGKIWQGGEKY